MNVVRQASSPNLTNPHITVVEADNVLASALAHSLTTEGYIVENVDRGDEAVQKLADAPPDLVIVEWMLPGMSGPEICTRLRAEDATRTLPVIMLSSRGEESLRLRGFSAGADDFVIKPFSMRELIARVRALLRRSRFAVANRLLIRGDLQLDHETRRVRRGLRDVRSARDGPSALAGGTRRLRRSRQVGRFREPGRSRRDRRSCRARCSRDRRRAGGLSGGRGCSRSGR
jgi:two-component system phosphate regulon response regulator PhoB